MTRVIPVLRVFDYAKTIEFYIEWLGFKVNWEHKPGGSPFYMQVSLREAVINLSEHHGECSPGACICLTEFTGLASYHQELIGKKYKYMNPGLEKVEWDPNTQQMTVIDPFYNRLIFSESMPA